MIAAVFRDPRGQICFRHEHAARVIIADIEYDQRSTIVVFGSVMG